MGVFRRTSDILAANVNDLVDYFEQPQRMLRQAVRDMEASLTATRSAVARSIGSEKLLAKTRAEHLAQIEQWRRRAAAALAEGDETLACAAVARQIDRERALDTVERQLADAHEANETLRRQLHLFARSPCRGAKPTRPAHRPAVGRQRPARSADRTDHSRRSFRRLGSLRTLPAADRAERCPIAGPIGIGRTRTVVARDAIRRSGHPAGNR